MRMVFPDHTHLLLMILTLTVFQKYTFSKFCIRKKLTLTFSRSRSIYDYHFNKLESIRLQVHLVLEKNILKGVYHIWD